MFVEIRATKQSIAQRKPIYGVGINDATYLVTRKIDGKQSMCPYYRKWKGMLQRCYKDYGNIKNKKYSECSMCNVWLLFSVFKNWMGQQDWQGKELDKDLLLPGNKVYSSEACIFVSQKVNTLLTNHESVRGNYPQGVSYDKEASKFSASCSVDGKRVKIGRYKTIRQADVAYRQFKSNEIMRVAGIQDNTEVAKALYRHAALIV